MSSPRRFPRLTAKNVALYSLGIGIPAFGGVAFIYKMSEFTMTILNSDVAGFGATAIATYLTGMLPLLMLTLWAIFSGHFRDVERPKYRLFELHDEIERGGELGTEGNRG